MTSSQVTPQAMKPSPINEDEFSDKSANTTITHYFLENSEEFRLLDQLRKKGWKSAKGDEYFHEQRRNADNASGQAAKHFFRLMDNIGEELHYAWDVFSRTAIDSQPSHILDMCMAPGGFLRSALRHNATAHVKAFTLPVSKGGHKVLLPKWLQIKPRFLDVTMLAADMGVENVPPGHPDEGNFLPHQFKPNECFDLAICDGQVLRMHSRASYRRSREASRLRNTQLALSLEHLRPGGTMIVLLHKLESCNTVDIIWRFRKFAVVRLLKPTKGHTKRSSFYLIATGVQSKHLEACESIKEWKASWKSATFDCAEGCGETILSEEAHAQRMLDEIGPALIEMGRDIWNIQAKALRKAPFMKDDLV